jgi:TatD DNase family protein
MNLTDTHTHLHFDQFRSDIDKVIQRAQKEGVKKILTLGTDLKSSQRALEISKKYHDVYSAVGIHPTDIFRARENDSNFIKELATINSEVVAIGEIGLDLYWKEVPLKNQIPVFKKMLEIAEDLNLPVVIHNRNAQIEMQKIFREFESTNLRGVMHSFSGSINDAKFYLDIGLYISFTGVVTFKNFKELDVVKSIPLNKLLLETDSPFLAPVPKRGQRNEPSYIKYTAKKLSEILDIPIEEIIRVTAENAHQLFKWGN